MESEKMKINNYTTKKSMKFKSAKEEKIDNIAISVYDAYK